MSVSPRARHNQPPPAARDIQSTIDAIKKSLDEIVESYRWNEATVYGTGGGDPSAGGGRTPTDESDPAGNQAVAASDRSGSLRDTSKVLTAVQGVVQAEARRLRVRPATTERPDQFPPLISPAEHDRLTEAKSRRQDRGEGWGRG